MKMLNSKQFYKGAEIHTHYSAYVPAMKILDYISDGEWCKRTNLGFTYKESDNTIRITNYTGTPLDVASINKVTKLINVAWGGEAEARFNIIGGLFYYVIKDIRFYPQYIRMIADHMIDMGTDHVELRLKLGSCTQLIKHSETRVPIEKEIQLLYTYIREQEIKKGISIRIIASMSKGIDDKPYTYSKVVRECKGIIDIITNLDLTTTLGIYTDKVKFGSLITAFDLVGPEDTGKSLRTYVKEIDEVYSYMRTKRIYIPFIFHAGEVGTTSTIDKVLDNVRFALEYGAWSRVYPEINVSIPIRIGHGVQMYRDPSILAYIREVGIPVVLEFCPLSMVHLGNMDNHIVPYLIDTGNGIYYTINSDDTNKLNDYTINHNYTYMIDTLHRMGYTYQEIERELVLPSRVAIYASYCSDDMRIRMISKWTKYNEDVVVPYKKYLTTIPTNVHTDKYATNGPTYRHTDKYLDMVSKAMEPVLDTIINTNAYDVIKDIPMYIRISTNPYTRLHDRYTSTFMNTWNMLSRAHNVGIIQAIHPPQCNILVMGNDIYYVLVGLYATYLFYDTYMKSIVPNVLYTGMVIDGMNMDSTYTFGGITYGIIHARRDTYEVDVRKNHLVIVPNNINSTYIDPIQDMDILLNTNKDRIHSTWNNVYELCHTINTTGTLPYETHTQVYIGTNAPHNDRIHGQLNHTKVDTYIPMRYDAPHIPRIADPHTIVRNIYQPLLPDEMENIDTPYGKCTRIGIIDKVCMMSDDESYIHCIYYAIDKYYRILPIAGKASYRSDTKYNIPVYMVDQYSWDLLHMESNGDLVRYTPTFDPSLRPPGIVIMYDTKWHLCAYYAGDELSYVW